MAKMRGFVLGTQYWPRGLGKTGQGAVLRLGEVVRVLDESPGTRLSEGAAGMHLSVPAGIFLADLADRRITLRPGEGVLVSNGCPMTVLE
jgi:hypothetical protein